MVELVDVFPTVTTLAGLKGLELCPAVSFKVQMNSSVSVSLYVS